MMRELAMQKLADEPGNFARVLGGFPKSEMDSAALVSDVRFERSVRLSARALDARGRVRWQRPVAVVLRSRCLAQIQPSVLPGVADELGAALWLRSCGRLGWSGGVSAASLPKADVRVSRPSRCGWSLHALRGQWRRSW
jgi:hypothetical protein